MITKFGSCLGLVCVMILIRSGSAQPPETSIDKLLNLLSDLENTEKPTWELLEAALSEFKKLDDTDQSYKVDPKKRLLHDSVLLPFEKNNEEYRDKQAELIDAMFESYRKFLPFYVERRAIGNKPDPTPNCEKLYGIVSGKTKGKFVLTPELIAQAKAELDRTEFLVRYIIDMGVMPFLPTNLTPFIDAQAKNKLLLDSIEEARNIGDESDDTLMGIFEERIKRASDEDEHREGEQSKPLQRA